MSPRPRETSDQQILDATARVMQRLGPTATHPRRRRQGSRRRPRHSDPALRHQARPCFSPLCRTAPATVPQQFAAARAKYASPLKASSSSMPTAPASPPPLKPWPTASPISRSISPIPISTPSPCAQFRAIRTETKKLLDEAVAAHELRPCDTAEIARLIQQTNDGSMLSWAVYREGSLANWVRRDLQALLAPIAPATATRPSQPSLEKKALDTRVLFWYFSYAFVALVSSLVCKAVARSHLRPFFCPVTVCKNGQARTAATLLRGSESRHQIAQSSNSRSNPADRKE